MNVQRRWVGKAIFHRPSLDIWFQGGRFSHAREKNTQLSYTWPSLLQAHYGKYLLHQQQLKSLASRTDAYSMTAQRQALKRPKFHA